MHRGVGRTLIVRSLGQFRAFAVETGQRLWETMSDPLLEALMYRAPPATADTVALREFVRERMGNDGLGGLLSTDGRFVFAVEETGISVPVDDADLNRRLIPSGLNRLCAYRAQTGQMVWELGGPPGEFGVDEPGTFFLGAPLVAALLICLIGAVVSAFASTTGIIGALIPLAVPFLLTDQVNAIALIAALAISSSVVDCSPFSTNGALVVANADATDRELVFKRLMQWGMSIVVIAPLVAWGLMVVPSA